jgi:8-amino-7-oxononanoate synthase
LNIEIWSLVFVWPLFLGKWLFFTKRRLDMMDTFKKQLRDLKEKNLYRKIRVLEEHQGTRAVFEGRRLVLFCGNDYLGMSRHPRVMAAAHKAIDRYGVGARSARLMSGTTEAHERLEKKIAEFKRKEGALVFGSGFLANLGILTSFAGKEDVVIMDKLCHASLIDGARLSGAEIRVFPHKNYERCEELLKKTTACRKLLVTENVFGMDGDRANLKELIRLKKKYGALLIVDDAHGTGVFGKDGPGATARFSKGIDVIMGTLSKAIGGLGGFVAADKVLIDHLVNFARPFIFATALPPILCETAREAFCVIEEEPALLKKLWANIREVYQGLTGLGFRLEKPESAVLPVILGDEKTTLEAFETLLARGIFIPAVRYPTVPKGKARLRVTVSAAHTKKDMHELLKAFQILRNKNKSE